MHRAPDRARRLLLVIFMAAAGCTSAPADLDPGGESREDAIPSPAPVVSPAPLSSFQYRFSWNDTDDPALPVLTIDSHAATLTWTYGSYLLTSSLDDADARSIESALLAAEFHTLAPAYGACCDPAYYGLELTANGTTYMTAWQEGAEAPEALTALVDASLELMGAHFPLPSDSGYAYRYRVTGGIAGMDYGIELNTKWGVITDGTETALLKPADAAIFIASIEGIDYWSLSEDCGGSPYTDSIYVYTSLQQDERFHEVGWITPVDCLAAASVLTSESEALRLKYFLYD